MNRHQRRRAEARARKAVGYQHRLAAAFQTCPEMADELRCRVVSGVIEHDDWCAIYRHRPCSCVPNISLLPFDADVGVYVIDEQGRAHRSSRQ